MNNINLQKYINQEYSNNKIWFVDEIKKTQHIQRINKIINNKRFLEGNNHEVLSRQDFVYKGDVLRTSKIILNVIKPIILFHNSYIMGKKISLVGSEDKVLNYNSLYRKGSYYQRDYMIVDALNKYGNAYEYNYLENSILKSKLINPENSYPVYDKFGNYVAFIEYYKNLSGEEYFIVYEQENITEYSCSDDKFNLIASYKNTNGLPIHYINGNNDTQVNFGKSIIDDIKPIIEKIELLLSKLDDAVYIHSLNPIAYTTNLQMQSSDNMKLNADLIGHMIELEDGEFKFAIAHLDYKSIKLLYDCLMQQLLLVSCVPYHIMGQGNISNVSEVSLNLLFQLLQVKCDNLEIYLKDGFYKRFNIFDTYLKSKNIVFKDNDYVDIEFNYSKPINNKELLENLQTQYNMGAISKQTIIEKSELTQDVSQELNRIKESGGINE